MVRSAYTSENNFFGKLTPFKLVEKFGTPLYVYNENILRIRCKEMLSLNTANNFKVNYSVKANSNPELLKIIREEGLMADAMSPGELYMDKLAGYEPSDTLYIANNITVEEMREVIQQGCLLSVDSLSQLQMAGTTEPGTKIMIRLNPGIGAGHNTKVITGGKNTKFGISPASLHEVEDILLKYNLKLAGINQHIGSLFLDPDQYITAMSILLEIIENLPHNLFKNLEFIDFGGGFGIPYRKYENEKRLDIIGLGKRIRDILESFIKKTGYAGKFVVEPGRYIVAECGLLLGLATSIKNNGKIRYVGTNIGFNVLMRPILYDSYHDIEIYSNQANLNRPLQTQTIVGNICESGDILVADRELPLIYQGDIIGILDTGAYGFSMASNYNERVLPAEVLIQNNGESRLIRQRQTPDDLASCLILS